MMRRSRSASAPPFAIAAALSCALAVSSCTSISVNALPQPGSSYRGGYDIVIEFATVLNLPDHAAVVMGGTNVGAVQRVSIAKQAVDVTARIDRSVRIPSDIHAVLQQDTVLGDIYIALEASQEGNSQATLRPNSRIPLAHTTSPPQLEDTLANMAAFMASGSIQRVQTMMIGVNRVTPQHTEEIRRLSGRVSTDLSDLAINVDTADQMLSGIAGIAKVAADDVPMFQLWFSPIGMEAFEKSTMAESAISTLFPSLGSVYNKGYWLLPILNSAGSALSAVQKSKWAIEGEYRPWRKLFTDMFLPQDKYPAMNIVSVQTPDGREISDNVADVLRMLGATP